MILPWRNPSPRRKWAARDRRLLGYLIVLLGLAAWRFVPRPWHPTVRLEGPHHVLESTATPEQTKATARVLEFLYGAYSNRFGALPGFRRDAARLRIKLFKDQAEFRRVNPGLGWAEAFYRPPYCRAYFSADEANPHHWMLHESVHQLNREVAQFELARWLEEGLAAYFSTSRIGTNALAVGRIDPNTYPVWWIDELAIEADLADNLRNGSVIPFRAIIQDTGGPSMNRYFNLYYLHWWTLTHFLCESPEYQGRILYLIQRGGGLDAFEEILAPVDRVQIEWHAYVRRLKTELAAGDARLPRAGQVASGAEETP